MLSLLQKHLFPDIIIVCYVGRGGVSLHWWKLETLEQRRFFLLFGGGLLYVLPILLADRYYQDDLARSLYGATGWSGDGRPLTNWLM